MDIVVDKSQCYGCYACISVCPQSCIIVKEDSCGYIYPVIDQEKCINCNLCTKSCPSINLNIPMSIPHKAYAVWSLDSHTRDKSSSGGFATEASRYFIHNKGIVYAASITSDLQVRHTRIASVAGIEKAQGSKYVHSYIGDSYSQCRQDLKQGKKVLFIGTPCQIAGLKKYLREEYENLITIDLVCHGVPPQKMLKDALSSLMDTKKISSFSCRKGTRFILTAYSGKKEYRSRVSYDRYMRAFLDGINYREKCYDCQFAQNFRVSDLTIGDFWGLTSLEKGNIDESKGINVVLINTKKGSDFFELMKPKLFYEEKDVEEAVSGNSQLKSPSVKDNRRKIFLEGYEKSGNFIKEVDKIYDITTSKKIRMFFKNLSGKFKSNTK